MNSLHLILCLLMLISALLVTSTTNPVESVLFLIITFCNAGTTLLLFNLSFFGLLFIIIYVGAIAVLFLFVTMMLDIKSHSSFPGTLSADNHLLYIIFAMISVIILINFYLSLSSELKIAEVAVIEDKISVLSTFDDFSNIDVLGQVLYNYYLIYLPLAGFILLIALIGAIVLTLNFNRAKKAQLDSKQLSRTDAFISFFNRKSN